MQTVLCVCAEMCRTLKAAGQWSISVRAASHVWCPLAELAKDRGGVLVKPHPGMVCGEAWLGLQPGTPEPRVPWDHHDCVCVCAR